MPRINIYDDGPYQGGQPFALDSRYQEALNSPSRYVRPQTGAIRQLSYALGNAAPNFIVPGILLDFVLNNINTGAPVSLYVGDGEQLMITTLLGDGANLHPNVGKFVILKFLLGNVPVSDWLILVPERQFQVSAAPSTSVEYGWHPGTLPVTFTLKFDTLLLAMTGGNANVTVQGLVATGAARMTGAAVPNL